MHINVPIAYRNVARHILGRRSVNLLPIAQTDYDLSEWRLSAGHRSLVVSSNLTSTVKTFFF